jgi:hypothetical protein
MIGAGPGEVQRFLKRFAVSPGECDFVSAFQKFQRNGPANARARASDNGNLSLFNHSLP